MLGYPQTLRLNNMLAGYIGTPGSYDYKSISYKYDHQNKMLTLFTNKPGVLIGQGGSTIREIQGKVRSLMNDESTSVVIKEVDSFVPENVLGDEVIEDMIDEYEKSLTEQLEEGSL